MKFPKGPSSSCPAENPPLRRQNRAGVPASTLPHSKLAERRLRSQTSGVSGYHHRFLLLLSVLLPFPPHLMAAESRDPSIFEPEIRAYEAVDRRTPPPKHPILFVGSSSFRLWTNTSTAFPGQVIVNRGFGGSTMRDLLFYFDRIVVPYHPRAVVVYEGDNDLAQGRTPESVAADYVEFLDRTARQLPGTPVILLAVKPSQSRRTQMEAQRNLNARLQAFAAHREGVSFADTFSPVLDPRGEPDSRYFMPDRLHLNPDGYAVWQPVVADALNRLPAGSRSR